MKKLAVVIPVYNLENYILICLNSILDLENNDKYEIIIINDGSTDKSEIIIKEFIYKNYQFDIKYKHIKNHGVSYARNKGLELSNSEYVLFLDGDDFLSYDAINKILFKINNSNHDIYYYAFISVSESGVYFDDFFEKYTPIKKMTGVEAFKNKIQGKIWICSGTGIYRKKMLLDNQIFYPVNFKMGEDVFFINISLINSASVCFIEDVNSNILCRTNSAMREKFSIKYKDPLLLNKKLTNYLKLCNFSSDIVAYTKIDYVNFITDYIKRYIYSLKLLEFYKLKKIYQNLEFETFNSIPNLVSYKKKVEYFIAKNLKYIYFYITKIHQVRNKIKNYMLSHLSR